MVRSVVVNLLWGGGNSPPPLLLEFTLSVPKLSESDFVAKPGTRGIICASEALKKRGALLVTCYNDPTQNRALLRLFVLSNLKEEINLTPFRSGGTGFVPDMLPDLEKTYSVIVLVVNTQNLYDSVEHRKVESRRGDDELVYSTDYGYLFQIGPFVGCLAFPIRQGEGSTKSLAKYWNLCLANAYRQNAKGKYKELIKNFLQQGLHNPKQAMVVIRDKYLATVNNARSTVKSYKASCYKAERLLKKAQKKSMLWVNTNAVTDSNRMELLDRAVKDGVLSKYTVALGSIFLYFGVRKLLLPKIAHEGTIYKSGVYEFPVAVVRVACNGKSCVISTEDGQPYPHPHAEQGGGTAPPCWDEVDTYGARPDDPVSQLSNAGKADFLWYSSPYDYCMFILGYLNTMWDEEAGRYRPLASFGKLIEEREVAGSKIKEPVRGAFCAANTSRRIDLSGTPVPECACGSINCTCTCPLCQRAREEYASTFRVEEPAQQLSPSELPSSPINRRTAFGGSSVD